jgi:Zn-finger nucleic acid-binding protein
MTERNGIEIDYCPSCRGVWLDRGELDKIIERSMATTSPFGASAQVAPPAAPSYPPAGSSYPPANTPSYPPQQATYPNQRPQSHHSSHHDAAYYKKKKRESFFGELFDFD